MEQIYKIWFFVLPIILFVLVIHAIRLISKMREYQLSRNPEDKEKLRICGKHMKQCAVAFILLGAIQVILSLLR